MKMARFTASVMAVALVFTGAACGSMEPSDEKPAEPKKILRKEIDEAHYESKKECVKKYTTGSKKGQCQTYKTVRKMTDDKDWIIITVDGTPYDVDEDEWNSVNVGDFWPR